MSVHVSLIFFSNDGGQWSENYTAGDSSAQAAGLPLSNAEITKRVAFLRSGAQLARVRYATKNVRRDVKIQDVFRQGSRITLTDNYNQSSASAVYDLATISSPPAGRKVWFRGLAGGDAYVDGAGKDTVDPAFNASAKAWISALAAKGWGVEQLDPSRVGVLGPNPVVGLNGMVSPGTTTVQTLGPHGFAVGDKVIFSKVNQKNAPGLKGQFSVFAVDLVDPTKFVIAYATPGARVVTSAGGFVRKAHYLNVSPFDPSATAFSHVGSHDTKDSFFGSRGARRATRNRQSL